MTHVVWLFEELLDEPLAQSSIAAGDQDDGWRHCKWDERLVRVNAGWIWLEGRY